MPLAVGEDAAESCRACARRLGEGARAGLNLAELVLVASLQGDADVAAVLDPGVRLDAVGPGEFGVGRAFGNGGQLSDAAELIQRRLGGAEVLTVTIGSTSGYAWNSSTMILFMALATMSAMVVLLALAKLTFSGWNLPVMS